MGKRKELIKNALRGLNLYQVYQTVYGVGGTHMEVRAKIEQGKRGAAREIIHQIAPAIRALEISQPLNPEISNLRKFQVTTSPEPPASRRKVEGATPNVGRRYSDYPNCSTKVIMSCLTNIEMSGMGT